MGVETRPPAAPPGAGEAKVRTRCVGICGTDIHAYFGRQPFFSYPRVLGHELAVEVESVGPGVEGLRAGARCAVEPYLACGSCVACRAGRPNCCAALQVLGVHVDGGLRESFVVPASQLHPAEGLSDEQLALAETLVIGGHAVGRAAIAKDDRVLVVGAGPVGLAVAQAARRRGAHVQVLERQASRRDRLARLGLDAAPPPGESAEDTEAILRETAGELPTVVVDATGNADSMRASFHYAAHGGRLVLVGLFRGDVSFDDPTFHARELTVLASRNGTGADFRSVLAGLADGTLDPVPWVTHRFAPEELAERIATLAEPETACLKSLVRFASRS